MSYLIFSCHITRGGGWENQGVVDNTILLSRGDGRFESDGTVVYRCLSLETVVPASLLFVFYPYTFTTRSCACSYMIGIVPDEAQYEVES